MLLKYKGLQDSLVVRNVFSDLCKEELPSLLEKLLDEIDDKESVIRIPFLELDLSIEEAGQSPEKLRKEMLAKAEGTIREKLRDCVKKQVSIAENFLVTLKFYLRNGCLPVWSFYRNEDDLQEALESALEHPTEAMDFSIILEVLKEEKGLTRLEKLLPDRLLIPFSVASKIFSGSESNYWEKLCRIAVRHFGEERLFRKAFRSSVFEYASLLSSTQETSSQFPSIFNIELWKKGFNFSKEIIEKIAEENDRIALRVLIFESEIYYSQGSLHRNILEKKPVDEFAISGRERNTLGSKNEQKERNENLKPAQDEDGIKILIENAGLVLLAPFLPQLFKNIGLSLEETEVDVSKAIVVLRYLVFKEEHFAESQLVLEKIFCGLPLSQSLSIPKPLNDQEKEHCEVFLQSVIEHWSVLKSTSPEGLRNSFLQRSGMLSNKKEQCSLQVQKQSIDILIDRLPWSIGIIKTPWMKRYLAVNWI